MKSNKKHAKATESAQKQPKAAQEHTKAAKRNQRQPNASVDRTPGPVNILSSLGWTWTTKNVQPNSRVVNGRQCYELKTANSNGKTLKHKMRRPVADIATYQDEYMRQVGIGHPGHREDTTMWRWGSQSFIFVVDVEHKHLSHDYGPRSSRMRAQCSILEES